MEYVFETSRLKVRKFNIGDAEELYRIHAEDAVKRWFPNESYADIKETKGAIEFFAERVEKKVLPYVLAVVLKESGELIGDVGISRTMDESCEVEIGYVISENYRGKGYASELVDAIACFAKNTFGASVLHGRVIKCSRRADTPLPVKNTARRMIRKETECWYIKRS